jgi:hypothetical protein
MGGGGVSIPAKLGKMGYRFVMQGGKRHLAKEIGDKIVILGEKEAMEVLTKAVAGHHPIPKFLGGHWKQALYGLPDKIHRKFHDLLRAELQKRGLNLPVGGPKGSAQDWAAYFLKNPEAQRQAFDAVLEASRRIDTEYGTSIVRQFWSNIMCGQFTPIP